MTKIAKKEVILLENINEKSDEDEYYIYSHKQQGEKVKTVPSDDNLENYIININNEINVLSSACKLFNKNHKFTDKDFNIIIRYIVKPVSITYNDNEKLLIKYLFTTFAKKITPDQIKIIFLTYCDDNIFLRYDYLWIDTLIAEGYVFDKIFYHDLGTINYNLKNNYISDSIIIYLKSRFSIQKMMNNQRNLSASYNSNFLIKLLQDSDNNTKLIISNYFLTNIPYSIKEQVYLTVLCSYKQYIRDIHCCGILTYLYSVDINNNCYQEILDIIKTNIVPQSYNEFIVDYYNVFLKSCYIRDCLNIQISNFFWITTYLYDIIFPENIPTINAFILKIILCSIPYFYNSFKLFKTCVVTAQRIITHEIVLHFINYHKVKCDENILSYAYNTKASDLIAKCLDFGIEPTIDMFKNLLARDDAMWKILTVNHKIFPDISTVQLCKSEKTLNELITFGLPIDYESFRNICFKKFIVNNIQKMLDLKTIYHACYLADFFPTQYMNLFDQNLLNRRNIKNYCLYDVLNDDNIIDYYIVEKLCRYGCDIYIIKKHDALLQSFKNSNKTIEEIIAFYNKNIKLQFF